MRRAFFVALFAAGCTSGPKTYGPVYDSSADVIEASVVDAGADAKPADAAAEAESDATTCSSTVALIGGNATTLFAAAGSPSSSLSAAALTGSLYDCGNDVGCAQPVAIVRFGTGLLAAFATATTGALESSSYTTSWQTPVAIATAQSIDGPSLAVVGTTAHLLFQGPDYKYYHAQYATSWDGANDPVGGSGSNQSYGARGPSGAAASTTLVAVQAGSNSYLYDQTWSGSWAAAQQQGGAAIQNTLPPALVSLSGGASELLAGYLRNGDYKIMAVDRKAGTWTATPTLIDTNAYSNDPVTLVALPGGKALLVYRGSDKKPYWMTWDGVSTWTTAAPVLATSNPVLASVPSAAAGVCGADAFVAWAESSGGVTVVPFTAGAFGSPMSVSGTSGAKFVAVATLP
jgi:hypothetical protein